jgi:hypothetical protein
VPDVEKKEPSPSAQHELFLPSPGDESGSDNGGDGGEVDETALMMSHDPLHEGEEAAAAARR